MLRTLTATLLLAVCAAPLTAADSPSGQLTLNHCVVSLIEEAQLPARKPGALDTLLVEEGGAVQRGQVVARMDARESMVRRNIAQSEWLAAQKEAENDIDVRYSAAAADVAQAEYTAAVQANKRVPGTFAEAEVSRLRLAAWRYPSAASGLNLWEARLLANAAAHGPTAARVVAQTMSDGWEAEDLGMAFPYVDLEYFAALIRLAGGPAPLLTLDEDPDASLGAARVELTDAGRRVLEGRANALACVGPGAWVFNVPVSPSPGRAWVRDPFGSIVEHVIR